MILDASKVSLADGAERAAVDVLPGADLRSVDTKRSTHLTCRNIRDGDDVLCLVLSNGRKLCGSTDQRVGLLTKAGRLTWRMLSDILPCDKLRGECDGTPITVTVDAVLFYPKHSVRLVEFTTDQNRSYIAEGVSCR